MENKRDQTQINATPTPSTTANVGGVGTGISQGNIKGARAGQKSADTEPLPENHMSKADQDLAEYSSHEQDFGSDDFLADDGAQAPPSKRDAKYAETLRTIDADQKH